MAVDFGLIAQDATTRDIVQQGLLERAFHDSLFPRQLYRGEATAQNFGGNLGDSRIFTAAGLIAPDMQPIQPGFDPSLAEFGYEQWESTVLQYGKAIDTLMPTDYVAIASTFMRNAHQLGMHAGQSLNRIVRDRMFNAAESGWTVADGTQAAVGTGSTLRVKRLNGLTRARNANLADGSKTRYAQVSANNPLQILLLNSLAATVSTTIVAYTSDFAGDEIGPGTITLGTVAGGPFTFNDRSPVRSIDRTDLVRVGGGNSTDAIGPNDILTLDAIRAEVAKLRTMNVPEMADGSFHCHLDPTGEAQVFASPETQRMLTSMPDYFMYADFAIGRLQGTAFIRNTESPAADTVVTNNGAYTPQEQFAPELFSNGDPATGVPVHRALFVGQGSTMEYFIDLAALITEVGVTGKVGSFQITNNSIQVVTDRVQLIFRAPLDRLQQKVGAAWNFIGDWPVRTDGAVGKPPRYKRLGCIQFGE